MEGIKRIGEDKLDYALKYQTVSERSSVLRSVDEDESEMKGNERESEPS